ncbi:hypothetical protein AMJ71_06060 [candidate division TA06 bacterium SM1_40]|uniref:Uncharacterized protein n=2 Tax=Bacteria division TA06 TaxID=1156500 RepID=A0A0S8JIB2_UNCT6|nr:MAG: hypothetical protein AMJ82_12235 [candidate division TA06 bacterium SM23_40]KPL09529.1 MAG: hypothetical protein AMJ71_06060 [candidate division TA06 bacterium SM1_40]
MADVEVLLLEAREDLACSNCGTTQEHRVRLYYNVTRRELHVSKQCKCDTAGTAYVEHFDVGTVMR